MHLPSLLPCAALALTGAPLLLACSATDRNFSSSSGTGGAGGASMMATSSSSTASASASASTSASSTSSSGGPTCGDNVVDPGEQCDGQNLAGNDCTTLGMGFTGGTLTCSACKFITSGCTQSACPGGNCSLSFSGVSQYVAVPPSAGLNIGQNPLTVEAWVYFEDIAKNCMAIVRKGTMSSPTYDYWLHKNFGPADSLLWGSYNAFSVLGSSVTSKKWTHIAGVYDPAQAQARLYINGAMVGQAAPMGAPLPNNDELRIGIDWDLGCAMYGRIDEVRISSVARYAATFTPQITFAPDAATIALYHFDENTGPTAADSSGNGHDGTLKGATWSTDHP